ncbi:MAG TPA: hypothetical protein VM093_00035 [Aeromicrobium sp.]|nr:hypothetical protein [Aeromicrobium sp.]
MRTIHRLAGGMGIALLSGCGSSGAAPAQRADEFYAAVAHNDAAAACASLASSARSTLEQEEKKPCRDTILEQDLPRVSGAASGTAKVYGSLAQVTFANESVFLSRYSNGWRVTAAGCTPSPQDRPYECTITAD